MRAWFWIPVVSLLLLAFLAEWLWRPRLGKDRSIAWALWQLPIWFAVGAVPTYLLGVICSTIKGEASWSSIGAIMGGVSVGFGAMHFVAVPFLDLALGVPRRRVLLGGPFGRGVVVLPVCLGLVIAVLPLVWPNHLVELGTPEARRGLVQSLQSPNDSTKRKSAELLGDFGTPEEIPALEKALTKAHESADTELERICERALARIRRR